MIEEVYELIVARPAARAIAELLPETVAAESSTSSPGP